MSNIFSLYREQYKTRYFVIAICVALAVAVSGYLVLRSIAAEVYSVPHLATELPANEASGLVASRTYPGVMWWNRDGGTSTAASPRNALYALKFDASGKLQPVRGNDLFPFYDVTGDTNTQWEDLALDDQNNLWIGEIGSNDCNSPQYLYKLDEPNPASTAAAVIKEKYSLKFPDPVSGCTTTNAEAMFWLDGHMYIFAKAHGTPVYRIDLPPANGGQATLTKLGEMPGINTISGASISDDRTRMMVQHHQKFFVYVSGNPTLRGDAYIKDMISRSYKWYGTFDSGSGTVEGGTFVHGAYDLAFVAESKEVYYAKPVEYGDKAPVASPAPAASSSTGTTAAVPTQQPAATAPAATALATGCTVTDKLVNTCRPWLGAAANKYPGVTEGDYKLQIEAHEGAIGRKVDIAHTYHSVGSNTLSANDKYFINRANTYLFTNWKPAAKWSDAAGGNAAVNKNIDTMADSIKATAGGKKMFLTLNHEPENDVSGGGNGCSVTYKGSAGTPADYRAMWANIRARFDAKGVTNVIWVMDYMNFANWDCLVDDLYPGNDLVDWVMFNAYGYGTGSASNAKNNIQHFVDVMKKSQSSTTDFNSKPWGIVEWDVHDMPAATSYKYYDDMKAIANNNTFPNLKAYMVFDSIGPEGNDNRIGYVDGTKDDTRLQHYKDFANSAAFSGGAVSGGSGGGTAPPPPPPAADTVKPSVPGGLSSTGKTTTSVGLKWNASSDNTAVTGYAIYRNGNEVGRTAATSYTVAGLAAGTSYSFTVSAYDAAGNMSAQSAALTVTTTAAADTTPPTAPGNVKATAASATKVTVTWSAATDNTGVTGYIVQRDGVTIAQTAGNILTYSDTTVLPLTSYSYAVRAADAAGNTSASSASASVTTPVAADTTAPSPPSALNATVVSGQINLKWTAATDNVRIKDYLIYRDGVQLSSSTSVSYGDATMTLGIEHSYQVAARDAAGNLSAKSNIAKATVPAGTPSPQTGGLAATYFPNTTLTGRGYTRTDGQVAFNWGTGAPLPSVPADTFSARWTGRVVATANGTYTFYTQSDDGVRLYIDDKLVIDDWRAHGVTERSATVNLQQGQDYNIKLEYFENTGAASVRLLWAGPGIAKQVIPAAQFVSSSHGLYGVYFTGKTLSSFMGGRVDPGVDFSWSGSPFSGVPADSYSVRWTGKVQPDTSGTYTFYTRTNDGARLWVNGKQLVNDWRDHGTTENSGTIALTAGNKYDVTLEFYDNTGQGVAQLLWSGPSHAKQIIPEDALFDR